MIPPVKTNTSDSFLEMSDALNSTPEAEQEAVAGDPTAEFLEMSKAISDDKTVQPDAESYNKGLASGMSKASPSRKSFDDNTLNELEDKNIDIGEAYQDTMDVSQELYDNQGVGEMIWRAGKGGLYKGSLTALENMGYMADIPQMMRLTDDLDKGYSNWLSEFASDAKKEYSDENPIYSQEFGDAGWFGQLAESAIDSSVGFMIPGGIAGKVIGRAGKMLGAVLKADARFTQGASTTLTAFLTNHAESAMMGQELWQNVYDQAVANGIDPKLAAEKATDKEEDFRMANKINVVSDFVALKGLVSGKSLVSGNAKKSLKQWGGEQLKQAGAEGFEEGLGGFQQKEHEREGLMELGVTKNDGSSTLRRAVDYAKSDEGMTEIIAGIGSGPMQAGGAVTVGKGMSFLRKQAGLSPKPRQDPGEFKSKGIKMSDFGLEEGSTPKEAPKEFISWDAYKKEKGLPEHTAESPEYKEKKVRHNEANKEAQAEYEKDKEARAKYDAAVAEDAADKIAHDKLRATINEEAVEFEASKNAGTVEQTKMEVGKFLAEEANLAKEYEAAVLAGDETGMADIENKRFENLYFKHAKQHTASEGEGSLEEQLKAVLLDEGVDAEGKKTAQRMLDKMPAMQKAYSDVFGAHSLQGVDKQTGMRIDEMVWKTKVRMDNTGELLGELNTKVEAGLLDLAQQIKKTEGKDADPEALKLVQLRAEMVALKQAEAKIRDGKFVDQKLELEMEKRRSALDVEIKKHTDSMAIHSKEYKESTMGVKEIESHAAMENLNKLMTDQAMTKTAYEKYKSFYGYAKGKMGTDIKVATNEILNNYLDKGTEEAIEETRDYLNNPEVQLSKKDRAALEKKWAVKDGELKLKIANREADIARVAERRTYIEETTTEAKRLVDELDAKANNRERDMARAKKKESRLAAEIAELEKSEGPSQPGVVSKKTSSKKLRKSRNRYEALKESNLEEEEAYDKLQADRKEANRVYQEYNHLLKYTPKVTDLPGMDISIGFDADNYNTDEHNSPKEMRAEAALNNNKEVKDALVTAARAVESGQAVVESGGLIQSTDSDEAILQAPAGQHHNKKEAQSLPQNVQFVSFTDGWSGKSVKDNSAMAEWLETQTGNKVGMTLEYVIMDEGKSVIPDKAVIRVYVLNKEGKRVTHNGQEVYGFVGLPGGNYDKTPGAVQYLKEQRAAIFKARKDGVTLKPVITEVGIGQIKHTEGAMNDLRREGVTGADIKLAINDGERFQVGGGKYLKVNGNEVHQALTSGFVYAIVRGLDGQNFPLKMNSRKVTEKEGNVLFSMISDIFQDNKKLDDIVDNGDIKGLSYKDAINLLVFEDSKSVTSKYPFKMDFTKGTVILGGKEYTRDQLDGNQAEIVAQFRSMWRTTRSDMINSTMGSLVGNKFTWFGKDIATSDSYNDFLMNDKALSTNATMPEGRLFTRPYLEMSDHLGQASTLTAEAPTKEQVQKKKDIVTVSSKTGHVVEQPETQGNMVVSDMEDDGLLSQEDMDMLESIGNLSSDKAGKEDQEAIQGDKKKKVEPNTTKTTDPKTGLEDSANPYYQVKPNGDLLVTEHRDGAKVITFKSPKGTTVIVATEEKTTPTGAATGEIRVLTSYIKKDGTKTSTPIGTLKESLSYIEGKLGEGLFKRTPEGGITAGVTAKGEKVFKEMKTERSSKDRPALIVQEYEEAIEDSKNGSSNLSKESRVQAELNNFARANALDWSQLTGIDFDTYGIKDKESYYKAYAEAAKKVYEDAKAKVGGTTTPNTTPSTDWGKLVIDAASERELDAVMDQINKAGLMTPDLLNVISKKRDTLTPAPQTPLEVQNTAVKKERKKRPDSVKKSTLGDESEYGTSLSLADKKGPKVNIKKESNEVRKMLPNVPQAIHNGLIGVPGGMAEGMFHAGLMTLSDVGRRGVAYHEAFHAISQMYLSKASRDAMYAEAREVYGALDSKGNPKTDRQLEEDLAEGFRAHMIEKGMSRKASMPKVIKWLYESLMDLLEVFTNKKKRHIFDKIREGRFHYKPTNSRAQQILYSMSLPGRLVQDAVDGIKFYVVNASGIRSNSTSIETGDLMTEINSKFWDKYDAAYDAGDDIAADNLEHILDNWAQITELAKIDLAAMEVTERKDTADVVDTEDDIDGSLNIKNAFEFSGKNSATNSTRLLVGTLQAMEYNEQGETVRPNTQSFNGMMPALADFATSWSLLETHLTDIVSGDQPGTSEHEKMLAKLDEIAKTHAPFRELAKILKDPAVPRHKKVQFYQAFHKQNSKWTMSIGTPDGKGTKWRTGDADVKRKGVLIRDTWEEVFKNAYTDDEGKMRNLGNLKKIIDSFVGVKKAYMANDQDLHQSQLVGAVTNALRGIGIDVNEALTERYINEQAGTDIDTKTRAALIKLQYIFKSKDTATYQGADINLTGYGHGTPWNDNDNVFRKQKAVLELATLKGELARVPGEGGIVLPDGSVVYPKSENSFMSKDVAKWKATGGRSLSKRMTSDYHKESQWGQRIVKEFNEEGDTTFALEVIALNKLEDGRDMGHKSSDITEVDDAIDRMNRTLAGVNHTHKMGSSYIPLTYADKSTTVIMSGIPMTRFKNQSGIGSTSVDAFLPYAMAEIGRISTTIKRNLKDNPQNIKHFSDTGGLQSFWFPSLSQGGELATKLDLYSSNGDYNMSAENMQAIRDHIEKSLEAMVAKETKVARKMGILNKNKVVGVDKDIQAAYNTSTEAGLNDFMSDYTLNSMIANIEFTMLFTGDPAYYKDLPKRTAATQSTGGDLINMEGTEAHPAPPTHFNVAVLKDVEVQSELYDEYLKELGQDKADVYKNMNKGDAQGYISPERFRNLMIGMGKWHDGIHDKAFDLLTNKKTATKDQQAALSVIADLMRDAGVPTGQPLKGTHFELRGDSNQTIPTFLKYSQATLWPAVIKGTQLENISAKMTKYDVDELVFESGVKVGAQDVTEVSDDMVLKPFRLDNYYWKLQQDLPAKYDKKGAALVGSQPKKNILANLQGRTIEWNGEKVDGEKFAEMIHKVERMLSDEGVKKLKKTIGTDKEGNIKDVSKLYKSLTDKLQGDKASNNIIAQTKTGVPFDVMFQYIDKLDSEVHSSITKATTKLTSPGGSFIQMSNVGMEAIKPEGMSITEIKDISGIIYLTDIAELKGARREGGTDTISADVFLPFKAVEGLLKQSPSLAKHYAEGTLTGALIKEGLGDTTENLVGYRIPNQGMSSIDTLNIAGILPAHMGDTIVTYSEVTAKTGSDFDIDKMYVMMYNTRYNEATDKLERVPSTKASVKGMENQRIELWSAILNASDTYADLITPLDSEFLKNDAYFIAFLEEVRDADATERAEILAKVGAKDFDEFLAKGDRVKLANKYFKEKPLGALEFASPSHQLEIKKRNMAGKAGVGQTANHLTHHPLSQLAKLSMGYIGIGNKTEDGTTDLAGTYINEVSGATDEQITAVISAWLNAYVDNAKDPYISLINNNTETANTVFMLLRAGVDPEWVNRFMSQPMIKEYVEHTFASKSKNIKPEADKKEITTYDAKGKPTTFTTSKYVSMEVNDKFEIVPIAKDGPLNAMGRLLKDAQLDTIHMKGLDTSTTGNLEAFSVTDLENNIATGGDEAQQFALLKEFLVLQKRAEKLNDVVKASKSDTKGAFGNSAENLQARERLRQVMEEGHISNIAGLFDETMLGAFYENGTEYSDRVTSKLFLSKTQAVEDTIKSLMERQGLGEYATNKKFNQAVMAGVRSYAYAQSDLMATTPKQRRRLLKGETSSYAGLKHMKKAFPGNVLLDHFHTKINDTDYNFLVTDGMRGKDQTETDMLWQEWERMIASPEGSEYAGVTLENGLTVSEWAKDLVKYAFVTSGFKKGVNTFFDLIPHTYMQGEFNATVETFLTDAQNGGVMENFITDFIRHNYNDNMFVPSVTVYDVTDDRTHEVYTNWAGLTKKHGMEAAAGGFNAGFSLPSGDSFPVQFTKEDSESMFPVQYVHIANEDNIPYLYEYAGYNAVTKKHFYQAVQALGMSKGGNKVVEHGHDISAVNEKVGKLTLKEAADLHRVGEFKVEPIGALTGTGTGPFSFEGTDVSMSVVDTVVGDVSLKAMMMKTEGRDVTVALSDTTEGVVTLAANTIQSMGANKLDRILKQPC